MSKSKQFEQVAGLAGVDKMCVEAYSPPTERQRSEHIVSLVCRIMDDGPRPMRSSRPAQKNLNAAEQFDAEHQAAYEAHAKPSRDRMQAVRLHNTGYPKMHDELNKKRSTAKVTMRNAQRNGTKHQTAYNRCNAMIKNKKQDEPKKKRPSFASRDSKRRSKQPQSTRITKPKCRQRSRRNPRQIYELSKIRTNRGCQYSNYIHAKDEKSGTNDILLNLEPQKMAEGAFSRETKGTEDECKVIYSDAGKNQSKTSQYSKDSWKRDTPDTDPSVSSYNSYGSLEDEPMV